MKNIITKITTVVLIAVSVLALSGCKYRKDGSVIQDVKVEISVGDETFDSTFSLYETFAPETTSKILKALKDKYYDDKEGVISNEGEWLTFGAFKLESDKYVAVSDEEQGETVVGEFYNGGIKGNTLTVQKGSLVLLRDEAYDSGRLTIALMLSTTSQLDSKLFCVFGMADSDSVSKISNAVDTLKGKEDYTHRLYIGDRNDKTDDIEYFVDGEGNYLNAEKVVYDSEDEELKTIVESKVLYNYVIPYEKISLKFKKVK